MQTLKYRLGLVLIAYNNVSVEWKASMNVNVKSTDTIK